MDDLTTEQRNAASLHLDSMSALEIVRLMNQEDARVAPAVGREAERIAQAIDWIAEAFRQGGRLVYQGAGTSGRLGVLDASECPPTFSTPPEMVVGLIAGGPTALTRAVEGAEDHPELAVKDLQQIDFSPSDVLVGIATSGRTPYVLGGLDYARTLGAKTIGLTCNAATDLHGRAQLVIAPVVGPEVLSGSTRLKAGTATKMVLNMLSTGAMVRIGKTYGNLMVDLRATNTKLRQRSVRIVREVTGLRAEAAQQLLERCQGEVKVAIVAHLAEVSPEEADALLQRADGHLRAALALARGDRGGAMERRGDD
ncbi:MAG: N-acetylmuramic acid 6-phosphate etherase [Pirellulaceae bacterium]|nr:MAG: N-acetylmuramic acid 6-phosphate etherase [Pirellulaceae bacterium]